MTTPLDPLARARSGAPALRATICVALAMILAAFLAPGSTAEAATKYGTVRAVTQKMSGPHLPPNYVQHGWYPVGRKLALKCYVWGQRVSGWGGVSNLWYQVSDDFYVADIDLYTGSNNPITGACPTISHGAFVSQTRGYVWENSDGTWPGECVSLVSLYLLRVKGIKTGAWGNAVDYRDGGSGGKKLKERGFKWRTDRSFRDGDILVWRGGPSNVGHIAIWHGGRIYDQNNGQRRSAGSAPFFSNGYLGYWRK